MGISNDKKMTAFINSNRNVQGYNHSLAVKIYILPGYGSMKTLPSSGSLIASSSSKNGIIPDWAGWNAPDCQTSYAAVSQPLETTQR